MDDDNSDDKYVTIRILEIVDKTDKAIKVRRSLQDGTEVSSWIPKSVVERARDGEPRNLIRVPRAWFLRNNFRE